MSVAAVAFVFASATTHATWNLVAKRTSHSGVAFVWLFDVVSVVLFAPWAIHELVGIKVSTPLLMALAVSTVLHLAYFLVLQAGYRSADLSVIYPLARGTGPLVAVAISVALAHEQPGPHVFVGAVSIAFGAIILGVEPDALRSPKLWIPTACAVATGVCIGTYTVWDKHSVADLTFPPIAFNWGLDAGRAAVLLPWVLTHRQRVCAVARTSWEQVIEVGVLSPVSYILFLYALTLAPVSTLAPLRETAALAGVLIGNRMLGEGHVHRRLGAAGLMLLGIVLIIG